MPIIFIISVVFQIICGIHVVRTGQDRYWLFLIIIGSYLGCAIYAVAVMIPYSLRSRQGIQTINKIQKVLNPTGNLQNLNNQLSIRDTPQVHLNIADEFFSLKRYSEALKHYQQALTPQEPYEPNILIKIAQTYYNLNQYDHCLQTLTSLLENNPSFVSQDGHLLQARALQGKGDLQAAEEVYKQVVEYYSGPQAQLYYAQLLHQQKRDADACKLLDDILSYAKIAPAHYKRFHKECLAQAQQLRKKIG